MPILIVRVIDVERTMSSTSGILPTILQIGAMLWPISFMLILGLTGSLIVAIRSLLKREHVIDYQQFKRPDRR